MKLLLRTLVTLSLGLGALLQVTSVYANGGPTDSYATTVFGSSPSYYWPLNESLQTGAIDYGCLSVSGTCSASNNNAPSSGTNLTGGTVGTGIGYANHTPALNQSGRTVYSIANSGTADNGALATGFSPDNFTIEFWMRSNGSETSKTFMSNMQCSIGYFQPRIDDNGHASLHAEDVARTVVGGVTYTSSYVINDSANHYIAWVHSSSSNTWTSYVDNNAGESFSFTSSGGFVGSGSRGLSLGYYPGCGVGERYQGFIGDVALYNTALSSSTIANHQDVGQNAPTPTPTPTITPTQTPTQTFTPTLTPTSTQTPTPTSTRTPTPTPTPAPSTSNNVSLGSEFNIWWNNPNGNDYFYSGIILPGDTNINVSLSIKGFTSAGSPGYGDQVQCGSYPIGTLSVYTFAQSAWSTGGTLITPPGGCELNVITTTYSPGTSYQSAIATWSSSINPSTFSVQVSGHGCVRAQPLDSGGTSCVNGDIVASRAIIGFSQISAADAETVVCGRFGCAETDDSGYYNYNFPSWPSGSDLFWQFQGSGWCAGCGNAYFKWIPAGGYKILGISQSTISTNNDFIFDAQLYRGASAYNGAVSSSNIFLLAPGTVDSVTGQSATLSDSVQSAIQSAENALAAAHGATAENTTIGFGRFITTGGALKLAGGVGTVVYALFFNPTTTGDAVLSFPDNGSRITIAPQTTVVITLDPVAEPQGIQEISGTSVAVDTLISTEANPTPATFPSPATFPTTTTSTGTGTGTTTTTTTTDAGNTTCGPQIFALWNGLGPLLICLFVPTQTITDAISVTQADGTTVPPDVALQTKLGFADWFTTITFLTCTDASDQCFQNWFSGGDRWNFCISVPFEGIERGGCYAIMSDNAIVSWIRPFTTIGAMLSLLVFLIALVKAFLGFNTGVDTDFGEAGLTNDHFDSDDWNNRYRDF